MGSVVAFGLIVLAGFVASVVSPNFVGLSVLGAIPLLWAVYRMWAERHYGLSSVTVHLGDQIVMTEHYGPPSLFRSKVAEARAVRWIRALVWTSRGLFVEMRPFFGGRSRVLPMVLFLEPSSVEKVAEWAASHRIPVDGVAPIAGGYVRAVDG